MVFTVSVLAAVLVLGSAILAQAQQRTILFVPSQTVGPIQTPPGGITAACTGGRPFTVLVDPNTGPVGGNCDQVGVGRPVGLVCDAPATITLQFVGSPDLFELSAFVCHEPEEGTKHASSAALVPQESEQGSESGDIDQSFEVTGTGENSNQCAGVAGETNTGNAPSLLGLLEYANTVEDFEVEEVGSDIALNGSGTTTCDQQANQSAASG